MQIKLNWQWLKDESIPLKTGTSITYTQQQTAMTTYGVYWIGLESYLDHVGNVIGNSVVKARDINSLIFSDAFIDIQDALNKIEQLETNRKLDAYSIVQKQLAVDAENAKPVIVDVNPIAASEVADAPKSV